jgi:hypothetical protein
MPRVEVHNAFDENILIVKIAWHPQHRRRLQQVIGGIVVEMGVCDEG